MTTDSLYPIFDSLAPLQFTCTDQLFGNRMCYVQNIIVVSGIDTVFSNPLHDSLMAVRDKGGNGQSNLLQICKRSLCPFKLCSLTTFFFICLRICCGLILLLVENFCKPAHFFQTRNIILKQLIFFLPVCFFQTRNIILNQLIYQLSKKGLLSFGVWFKNRGMAF